MAAAGKPDVSNDNVPGQGVQDVKIKTSTKWVVIFGVALFVLLFVGGGAWAYLANLSGAIIAQGQVVVLGKPKTVQHLDGGIISEINVDNGDEVAKGDVLIRLDDTLLKANIHIYQNRLREALARQARLVAERDQLEVIKWRDDALKALDLEKDPGIRQGQRKLYEARRVTMAGQVSQLKEKIKQFNNQLEGMNSQKNSKSRQLKLLKQELKGLAKLVKKGYATKTRYLAMERQKEDIAGQYGEIVAEEARTKNAISEAEIQILQVEREFRQSVLTELREVEQEVNDMTQQLSATQEQLKRVDIRAPIAGTIHELQYFTIGGVIGPGTPIMQIIPKDGGFEVEVNIEPQFVDEIHRGQEAVLRFSAFNQRTTPEIDGAIHDVSANVVVNEQTGMSFYKVRVNVSEEEINKLKGQPVVPGMPVEAFIKTRERTALNYLVKPLKDQVNRAFREE